MNNGDTTTLWNYLNQVSIVIPIIQRDFAQGRDGKEELRKLFLEDLKTAIEESTPLNLDFAYGNCRKKVLEPLDGQQRLTTLWIVHWYIAYKAGELANARDILQKFSYQTRVSARDFCNKLCELSPMQEEATLIEHIRNQNWFYSSWNQDPTIISMLRMLSGTGRQDGVVEVMRFEDYPAKWKWLTGAECRITFRVLDILAIGSTDDLYIKMNARGKALTSFENFKAELVDYIHKKASEQQEWKPLDCVEDGFGQKLDNAWTDIFWKLRSKDDSGIAEHQNHIDEIFFAFFNRFFFNAQAQQASSENWNKSTLYGENAFATLSHYYVAGNDIPLEIFQNLASVLDRWHALQMALESEAKPQLGSSWQPDGFRFLPEYAKNGDKLAVIWDADGNDALQVTAITVKQRAVFYAVCQWLVQNEPKAGYSPEQAARFRDWLRVVWNIVENSAVESNLPGALRLIDAFAPHSKDILEFLAGEEVIESKFAEEQVKEERQKAKQILQGQEGLPDGIGTWYQAIICAEKYAFFHGCIRFLYQDGDGKPNWDEFPTKWRNAQDYFEEKGIRRDCQVPLTKQLVFGVFNAGRIWDKLAGGKGYFFDVSATSWLTQILKSGEGWKMKIVHAIMRAMPEPELKSPWPEEYMTSLQNIFLKQNFPWQFMIEAMPTARLHCYEGNCCFYNGRYTKSIYFDVGSWRRNAILEELVQFPELNIRLLTHNLTAGSGLFYGYTAQIAYGGCIFNWSPVNVNYNSGYSRIVMTSPQQFQEIQEVIDSAGKLQKILDELICLGHA